MHIFLCYFFVDIKQIIFKKKTLFMKKKRQQTEWKCDHGRQGHLRVYSSDGNLVHEYVHYVHVFYA